MVSILLSGLITALSLLVVDLIVPGVQLDTVTAAAIAAASIGVVNAFVKPFLSTLSVPVNLLTFGIFSYVVNGLCFWLSSLAVPGFRVSGILGFLLGPVVLSFVGTFLGKYLGDKYPQLIGGANSDSPELSSSGELSTTDS
jgi:putative membrane protein